MASKTKYLGEHGGVQVFYDGDPENRHLIGAGQYAAVEEAMCREVMRVLLEQYPGYIWQVMADVEQGIATIALPTFMGPTLKFVIHLENVHGPVAMDKQVREAGGQLLERLRLSRTGLWMPEYMDAKAKAPKVFNSNLRLPE